MCIVGWRFAADAIHRGSGRRAYFRVCDGNGNVRALVKASDSAVSANYKFGPFGEPIRVTGPMAKENPFRFSTKRTDNTTDLVLYEYRPYSPTIGRWLSRDPIGERGGHGLYSFVENRVANWSDYLGLHVVGKIYDEMRFHGIGHAAIEIAGRAYGFGPKDTTWYKLLCTEGTTSGYEGTEKPRRVIELKIRRRGNFKDKAGGSCLCATTDRILECAEYFKMAWDGTKYCALWRNCRHYVRTIMKSCCLSPGSETVER